jgi:hypothetical protein
MALAIRHCEPVACPLTSAAPLLSFQVSGLSPLPSLSLEPLRFCCNPVTATRGSGRLVFFVQSVTLAL